MRPLDRFAPLAAGTLEQGIVRAGRVAILARNQNTVPEAAFKDTTVRRTAGAPTRPELRAPDGTARPRAPAALETHKITRHHRPVNR